MVEDFHEAPQQGGAVHFLTVFQAYGGRIGQVGGKFHLIDIDADADVCAYQTVAGQCVLKQHAANLLVAHVEVVGPFDRDIAAEVFADSLRAGHGNGLCEAELPVGREVQVAQPHANKQVGAVFGLPFVAALSASFGLVVHCGQQDVAGQFVGFAAAQVVHHAVQLGEMDVVPARRCLGEVVQGLLGQVLHDQHVGTFHQFAHQGVADVAVEVDFDPVSFVPVPGALDAVVPFAEYVDFLGVAFHHNQVGALRIDAGKDFILDTKQYGVRAEGTVFGGAGLREAVFANEFDIHDFRLR